MNPQQYSYTDAGFDDFLSRSIDSLQQANLDSEGPNSNQLRYDGAQISGAMGDIFRVGKIYINGRDGRILVSDGTVDRIVMGQLPDGTQGFAISKEGKDVLEVTG